MKVIETLESANLVLSAAFVVLLPLELLRRYRRRSLTRNVLREMAASASPLVPTLLTTAGSLAFASWVLSAASHFAPIRIATAWTSAAACILLVDFLAYVEHVAAHKVRLYWAIGHSVHHSSTQFDQTTGLRVSFVDGFTVPLVLVPAALVGFDPLLILTCFALTVAYQQWIHTELIGSLGAFDLIFNSPANHRVHHGVAAECIDRNFGSILMIWDHVFGTYRRERHSTRPICYGIVHPIASWNPWTVHTAEFARLVRDVRRASSIRDALRRIVAFAPRS